MEEQVLHHLQGVSRGAGKTNSTVTLSEGVNMDVRDAGIQIAP